MPSPRILALDLGTTTGYALLVGGGIVSGLLDCSTTRYEGGGIRFLRFAQHLETLLQPRPELVVFEEVRRHLGTDAAHVYGGLLAVLTARCERADPPIPYQGVPVGTIKQHATGKGNAPKAAMLTAAGRISPGGVADHNEADAVCLLDYARLELLPETVAEVSHG